MLFGNYTIVLAGEPMYFPAKKRYHLRDALDAGGMGDGGDNLHRAGSGVRRATSLGDGGGRRTNRDILRVLRARVEGVCLDDERELADRRGDERRLWRRLQRLDNLAQSTIIGKVLGGLAVARADRQVHAKADKGLDRVFVAPVCRRMQRRVPVYCGNLLATMR